MIDILSMAVQRGGDIGRYFTVSYTTAYFLCIAAFVFSMICSFGVNSTFKKYSKYQSRRGRTAAEVARQILDDNGLGHISVTRVAGNLTDHYDPRTQVVALSDSVHDSTSLAAIGVAAHECGHAVQHAKSYIPIKIRSLLVPIANIGSKTYIYVFLLGIIFSFDPLVNIGIGLFAFYALFQLVTLPVEFNASSRAMRTLRDNMILDSDELSGARKTLTAAAMTYVAGLIVSLTQLLRLISMVRRRR